MLYFPPPNVDPVYTRELDIASRLSGRQKSRPFLVRPWRNANSIGSLWNRLPISGLRTATDRQSLGDVSVAEHNTTERCSLTVVGL